MTETMMAIAPSPLRLGDGSLARTAWTLSPDVLHVNHGSFGAVPLVAQQEQSRLRSEMEAAPVIWFPELPARVASTREAIAAFLRADAGDLALVPNASAGASVVYSSLPVTPGLEIVVTDHGYGAVTMGAERLARRWGGTVRTARVPLGATPEEAHDAIVAELGDKTGLIVVDQITSATARFLPVDTVAAVARERGIAMLVDAAHVPGLVADPLAGLDCDFWVGNLHKFGCAPRGTAALIARGPLRDELYPLIDSWGAPQHFPERFDTQGTVDATAYLSAPTALDFIGSSWGWDAARRYLTALADYAEATIAAAFTNLTGEDHRADVGSPVNALRLVRLPTGLGTSHAEADALRDRVAAELGIEAAFTSFAGVGYFRLSTHVYNTAADFEEFADRCVPALVALAASARGE
ncbi:aminotransferase class V-fold PLP-dependent enzyme [Lacisediminihabitans profunda]|uniref:Aminotransferase class V-fold PLP-dependent enzyme n=1 Tax=Lacisediminihabitans profunda TaxID=2594790 RepID=A0A5C8USA5_9MICO|nr:aminotransferase class V-fold PLP-dependent enzyme [Lacisediminihabitans profunda]TXN31415.1 aminotransferase class V-fold PLP-dependent enzyme [Lacisediminihabitans profunda]